MQNCWIVEKTTPVLRFHDFRKKVLCSLVYDGSLTIILVMYNCGYYNLPNWFGSIFSVFVVNDWIKGDSEIVDCTEF